MTDQSFLLYRTETMGRSKTAECIISHYFWGQILRGTQMQNQRMKALTVGLD